MHYGHEVLDELRPQTRELRQMIPDVYKGFGALHAAATSPPAASLCCNWPPATSRLML